MPEVETVDVVVPVNLLFRVKPGVDIGVVDRFVESVLEHGTVRDCFFDATDRDGESIADYDGYSVRPDRGGEG